MNAETREISTIIERAEAFVWEDIVAAAPGPFAEAHSIRSWRVDEAVGFMFDDPPDPFFNRVHGLGILAPATPSTLDAAFAPWQGVGRTCMVPAPPGNAPDALPSLLEARGFKRGGNWVKMVRGTEPPPAIPTDLRIEEVGTEQSLAYADIATEVFEYPDYVEWFRATVGRPGWHTYLGFDGSVPVACGQLRVSDDVGWLGTGGTLGSHRRRGAQGAIMARRVRDAIALGCRYIATETGEEAPDDPNTSYHNMIRTGFRLAYPRRNWIGTVPSQP